MVFFFLFRLNGSCVYEDILLNQEFDIFFKGRRAEFQSSLSGKFRITLNSKPAIAAMHGPHSGFDLGHCTVIHCDVGGVSSLVDQ